MNGEGEGVSRQSEVGESSLHLSALERPAVAPRQDAGEGKQEGVSAVGEVAVLGVAAVPGVGSGAGLEEEQASGGRGGDILPLHQSIITKRKMD